MLSIQYVTIVWVGIWPTVVLGAQTIPIYANGLESGWQNWSWSTAVSFNHSSTVYGGSGTSMAVTHGSAWAGLYLHSASTIDISAGGTLQFALHGATIGGHRLQVVPYDDSLAAGTAISLAPTIAGTWAQVSIPLASFGEALISGLTWQEASGASQPVYYLDEVRLVIEDAGGTGTGPDLTVDALADRHPISPYIYGMNFAASNLAANLGLPVRRFGGNATTRYNWQLDTSNRASDWYFENIPDDNPNPAALPDGSGADRFIDQDRSTSTDTIMTLPLIGWTPKARAYACGFSVAKYGQQQDTDPYRPDCGNGVKQDGSFVTGNDPHDTSVEIDETFVQDWIEHLISRYGIAANGGVRFYCLDNEPMLWNHTHRDVHPAGTSYDEMYDRTVQYAAAVKQIDPTAETLGPVLWGWTAYFYSARDAEPGGSWWNNPQDRLAHGNMPFVEWYLQRLHAYEQTTGTRVLDYLDLHYYPQASGVSLSSAGDAATQARRLRSTRSLWDPSYVDESWIAEPVRLIRRMRDWVDTFYPGTKLAITEYNWGAKDHINGAVAQADVLGIFGREQLDLATLWDPPSSSQPLAHAFRMYLNYNGLGGRFGEESVQAVSQNQAQVSIYAGRRADEVLTIMLINKTADDLTSNLTITHASPIGEADVYRYSSSNLHQIVQQPDLTVAGGDFDITIPGHSITLLVVSIRGTVRPDLDFDGDVDGADADGFLACLSGPGIAHDGTPTCSRTDQDDDNDVDLSDYGVFQRCLTGESVPADLDCDG